MNYESYYSIMRFRIGGLSKNKKRTNSYENYCIRLKISTCI